MYFEEFHHYFFIIILAIGVYLFPTLISKVKNSKNALAIFTLNFFLGWTAIGWLAALIWACTSKPKPSYFK
jgi:hypothetical protein